MRIHPAQSMLLIVGLLALAAAIVLGWGLASGDAPQVKPALPKKTAIVGPPARPAPIPPQPLTAASSATPAEEKKEDRGLPSNEALGKFLRGEAESSVK